MRNIVIVRGPQATGKSRFIQALDLEGHHLSFDKVREVVSGDSLGANGILGIAQQHNTLVRAITLESLKRRMSDGETIVFEATLPTQRDVKTITDMAEAHFYKILIVDFFAVPISQALSNNATRLLRHYVPEDHIRRCYSDAEQQHIDSRFARVLIHDINMTREAQMAVESFLTAQSRIEDVSHYRQIVHIGDLQGTYDPLVHADSPLAMGLRPDTLYIFCGDLFDRGVQNDKVCGWWLQHAAGKDNVILVAGNHEDHVERAARGEESGSIEWNQRTWPQLTAAGFGAAEMATIARHMRPLYAYRWQPDAISEAKTVLVTHGGLSRWPQRPELLPEANLRRGSGHYGQGIDILWQQAEAGSGRYQVHGHRNAQAAAIDAEPLSFNLEGGVEFGGHMRFLRLDAEGWTPIKIRAQRFRSMTQQRAIALASGEATYETVAPLVPWMAADNDGQEPALAALPAATLAGFENHDMVLVTRQAAMPHVASVSFTKTAFYTKGWDAYTRIARGLFFDIEDKTIVARSYEKFFNHGERPETSDAGLAATVQFPVDGYDKLNGFLCITGYSERTQELIIASKSRLDGTYAELAQKMVTQKLGRPGLERLLRFNRDQQASLLFEVIDPAEDPHIIDYGSDRLVLIGCVRRHPDFEQVDYKTLLNIGKWLKCEVKERPLAQLPNWQALQGAMRRIENNPSWCKQNPSEGIVFQDANGLQWKSKSHYYARWKRMRSCIERIALCRRKDVPFDQARYADMPDLAEFIAWAKELPSEALELGIIKLRNMYHGNRAEAESMGEKPKPKPKDMSGYLKALEAMAAQVRAGTAKPDSVKRILDAAASDADKRNALASSFAGAILQRFIQNAAA